MVEILKGIVSEYDKFRRSGEIKYGGDDETVFFHASDSDYSPIKEIRIGDYVTFSILSYYGGKHRKAVDVKIIRDGNESNGSRTIFKEPEQIKKE